MSSDTGIFAVRSTWLDAWIQIGVASGRVISLTVLANEPDDHQGDHDVLDRILAYLDEDDEAALSGLEIGLTVPTLDRAVYETIRSIPYGTVWSLEQLVANTPTDIDAAAARRAVAETPVPIVIPAHRVAIDDGPTDQRVTTKLRTREGIGDA